MLESEPSLESGLPRAQNEIPPGHIHRILVVDDHPVVRKGLAMTLAREPDLMVCGEAEGLEDALSAVLGQNPDLILADLELDGMNGMDLIREVKRLHPRIPVLVLSMHDEDVYAERTLRSGARGYLMKHEKPEVLVAAIRAVLKGEIAVTERIKSRIVANLAGAREDRSGLSLDRLTDRELEIFRLLGKGNTIRRISEKLTLSIKTIEAHCAHIKQKLGVSSGPELQYMAFSANRDPAREPD
jgi:DNA-binding NarL/FixJ family response regulator